MSSDKRLNTANSTTSPGAIASDVTGETVGTKRALHVYDLAGSGATKYAIRTDKTTTVGTTYVGYAAVASANSSAVWQIFKMVDSLGDLTITYADGNSDFDNVWNDRASLTYS
jgi:hypothetical protein